MLLVSIISTGLSLIDTDPCLLMKFGQTWKIRTQEREHMPEMKYQLQKEHVKTASHLHSSLWEFSSFKLGQTMEISMFHAAHFFPNSLCLAVWYRLHNKRESLCKWSIVIYRVWPEAICHQQKHRPRVARDSVVQVIWRKIWLLLWTKWRSRGRGFWGWPPRARRTTRLEHRHGRLNALTFFWPSDLAMRMPSSSSSTTPLNSVCMTWS